MIANNVDVVLNNWVDLQILRMFLGVNGTSVTTAFNQLGLAAYEAIEKEQESNIKQQRNNLLITKTCCYIYRLESKLVLFNVPQFWKS